METLHIQLPATPQPLQRALVGQVGSGDLEVMIEPTPGSDTLEIHIQTSVSGAEVRWSQLLQQIANTRSLPAMRMDIHDFAATPGVVRLRLEQAIEQASGQQHHEEQEQ